MNKVISTDRRVQRTRQALREALLSLMKEKDYNAITVEEITARANLGRTTFYLHYKDKEALLLEKFADLIQELVQEIGRSLRIGMAAGAKNSPTPGADDLSACR